MTTKPLEGSAEREGKRLKGSGVLKPTVFRTGSQGADARGRVDWQNRGRITDHQMGECLVSRGPGATTSLIYYGGVKGVGTLYWENKDGLRSMVDVFSTSNNETSHELIIRYGVTHVIVVSWDSFAEESARLARGHGRGQEEPSGSFYFPPGQRTGLPRLVAARALSHARDGGTER